MDLIAELHASQYDQLELDHLLRGLFPHVGVDGDDAVYAREEQGWALRLVYGGNVLVRIDPGPSLSSEDIRLLRLRVENDLLPHREPTVGRTILFARYPVRGCARVDGVLQVLPPPPESALPPFLLADHPFVIEYLFRPSPNVWVNGTRRADAEKSSGLLLNLIFEGGVTLPEEFADHRWTLVPRHEGDVRCDTAFLQGGYWIEGFRSEDSTFTALEGVPPLSYVDTFTYGSRRGIEPGRPLELPSDFPDFIVSYSGLSFATRQSFKRALYWFAHGQRAQPYSLSAHIVSLITAIEALIELTHDGPRCPECNKERESVTQRFIDFVAAHSPEVEASPRLRKEFYRLRSKVVHGGLLLRRDQQIGPTTGMRYHEEEETVLEVLRTTRSVLLNWLLRAGRSASVA